MEYIVFFFIGNDYRGRHLKLKLIQNKYFCFNGQKCIFKHYSKVKTMNSCYISYYLLKNVMFAFLELPSISYFLCNIEISCSIGQCYSKISAKGAAAVLTLAPCAACQQNGLCCLNAQGSRRLFLPLDRMVIHF